MAQLIGRIIGVAAQLLMLPFVIIFSILAGLIKARRTQTARLLFTGFEQSLLGKAQRTINMDESGLMSPDKDLLSAAKCIENARVQYQLIKSRERFDETFTYFLTPLFLQCNISDWRKVFDFFELESFGMVIPNQNLDKLQRATTPKAEAHGKSAAPTQTIVQSGALPGANENNHFYLRDASKEGLQQPIHIHFDTYKPALMMGNKVLPNPCTFLVTVDSPEFTPHGLTCRVGGINHKCSPQGVIDGVIAHVNMVRYEDDGSLERVYVQLLEDGRVVGQLIADGRPKEIANLDRVFFMAGEAVYLDGMGNPYDSDNQPRATREQEQFLEQEKQRMIDGILGT